VHHDRAVRLFGQIAGVARLDIGDARAIGRQRQRFVFDEDARRRPAMRGAP